MFTGGGSAGHVTVNLALIPLFLEEGWSVDYIGSVSGIERQLISSVEDVNYFGISTGKLRRYLDWQNIKDPFRVIKGICQAFRLIQKQKPDILFSKGGFVSVPVVLGAWLNRVPVLIHESDLTPGLANKLSIPFTTGVCTTFPETGKHLPSGKARYIGAIIREQLKEGNAQKGREFCRFTSAKPVLLIMGGSLGSQAINNAVRADLRSLARRFQIIHLCGKGQIDPSLNLADYRQYEYVNEELPDLLALSDIIVSRAGSNSIFEFLHLRKPMLLIPLTRAQSRGDQLLNAQSFETAGFAKVLNEEHLTPDTLAEHTADLLKNKTSYIARMQKTPATDTLKILFNLIKNTAKPTKQV
ncbi:undecaprenyldiphospho-muramoylpentapeptide beta-N-acetylglucosaminyltransferase [Paenibacillus pinihumi]|uniref:undecaprenyldiphospho-muramoylpentapeptide beta-N-acetylglucosaminyltransferase n=1 Tax=Paenibacillus pinihumi TaxID=669462 RepID=UPI0005683D90|nr:undecaprenyldiphospho-muramoylpentapeptide beta-N-acetylglucosaminyltransferase [Paenibacillus pinihumi]